MKKNLFSFLGVAFVGVALVTLASCNKKEEPKDEPETPVETKSYDFIIYGADQNNNDLSDNPVLAKYTIEYTDATYVSDTLIKKDGKYFFSENSSNYLTLTDSTYGLSYTTGYFANLGACANNTAVDVSWSLTTYNGGQALMTGIGGTPLEGLTSYEFVVNGWKEYKGFNFVVYEKDATTVVSYNNLEKKGTYVSDALKTKDGKYYLNDADYLVLTDSAYGLSYTSGYFANHAECANNTAVDVSWSKTTMNNGQALMTGIGGTPLEGLNSYEFIIDGWK